MTILQTVMLTNLWIHEMCICMCVYMYVCNAFMYLTYVRMYICMYLKQYLL
jgi:hypothetical protein